VAIRKKTVAYYACDRCRFQEQGTEQRCPAGWRYLNTLIPGKEQQPEIKALICPTCDEWLKQQLDAICIRGWDEEEEVESESSKCGPSLLSSRAERRKTPSIDPIRRLFEQREAEIEPDSSECTPSSLSSVSEQREPSAEDLELDSSQCTPSSLSSVPEHQEPSAEDLEPDSSECTPSSLSSVSEQQEPSAEDLEPDSSECTPSPLSSVSEQQEPSSIDSIRRLFRRGEEEDETDRGECLPSLHSYGTKPSTIDSIRRLIHHG
jgi:hypothetical protein